MISELLKATQGRRHGLFRFICNNLKQGKQQHAFDGISRGLNLFSNVENQGTRSQLIERFISWRNNLRLNILQINEKGTQKDLQKDIVGWFTGVLAVSSVILTHKWIHNKQSKSCPLKSFNATTLQNVVTDCLPRDHLVLAVTTSSGLSAATQNRKVSIDNVDKENLKSTNRLDRSVAAFQEVIQECSGTLLNTMALKFKKANHDKKAFELFLQASMSGHVSSHYNLGICYELGQGVKQSYEMAYKYYKLAAENGHAKSMYNIASFYYEGILEDSDNNSEGFSYMLDAAKQGLVQVITNNYFDNLSNDVDVKTQAQVFVANQFARTGKWEDAIEYFQLAVIQNDITSMFNLATCYDNGLGVMKDNKKGIGKTVLSKEVDLKIQTIQLYKRAADGGHILSQHRLGESYEYGLRGVSRDLEESMKWYKESSKQGHTPSTNRLELIEYELNQRNEDIVLKTLESNPILSLLKPIQTMTNSNGLHKSSSMPSLTKNGHNINTLSASLLPYNALHGSMHCINSFDNYYSTDDEGYNGSPVENKEFQLVTSSRVSSSNGMVPQKQCNCWFCQ